MLRTQRHCRLAACPGNDILGLHAASWLTILVTADLPLPDRILSYEILTKNEEKPERSLGNTLDSRASLTSTALMPCATMSASGLVAMAI